MPYLRLLVLSEYMLLVFGSMTMNEEAKTFEQRMLEQDDFIVAVKNSGYPGEVTITKVDENSDLAAYMSGKISKEEYERRCESAFD